MRKALRALALAAVATVAASMGSAAFELKGEPKIAMIIYTQKNDGGWSQALDEARQRLQDRLGLDITVVENVADNSAAVRPVVDLFVQRGYNIILGSVFGYSDAFKELSEKYPDVAFLNPAGTTNGPNLQGYYGRTYESQYLCGMIAGAVSKSGKLGFVAANPLGLVNWTINGYALGARKTNPDATVTVVYTGAWNDPVKERAAAEALAEQGIDVIGQHVDTPAVQIVAQEKGIHGTGHHRDMREFAPKATQCSSVWVWDRYLEPEIRKIIDGEWNPDPNGAFLAIAEGGTDIACCGDAVSEDAEKAVMEERQALIDGKHVFAGPLSDREDNLRVPEGEVLSDGDLWSMDWFVEGVISQQ